MKKLITIKEMAFVSILSAITCVVSPFSLVIPLSPVPITFGLLAVFISGVLLTPKLALLSQIIYLLIGLAGVPVFSKFMSGFTVFAGPTGGYLITYPIIALIISFAVTFGESKFKGKAIIRSIIACLGVLLALAICYLCGTLWLSHVVEISFGKAFAIGVAPFFAFDLGKAFISIVVFLPIRSRLWRIFRANQINYTQTLK